MISDRAKRLIEALHDPVHLYQRWEIAQRFLDEERAETWLADQKFSKELLSTVSGGEDDIHYRMHMDMIAERIAQTRGHNGETE